MDPAPKVVQSRPNAALEAIETNEAVMKLDKLPKWSATYFYCYPNLPRVRVLKAIFRHCGHRLNWQGYLEQVDIARIRVWACLYRI